MGRRTTLTFLSLLALGGIAISVSLSTLFGYFIPENSYRISDNFQNANSKKNTFEECQSSDIFLMPHHLIVQSVIDEMYEIMPLSYKKNIIIVSPDHFSRGTFNISAPYEGEHGFIIHRDLVLRTLSRKNNVNIEGYIIKEKSTKEERRKLAEKLFKQMNRESTLVIFSIDFSHYLPGEIARVHDILARDVIETGSIEDVKKLEVDSQSSVETMLRLLALKNESMNILKNTNPSFDANVVTEENTTHMFGCNEKNDRNEKDMRNNKEERNNKEASQKTENTKKRTLKVTMYFIHEPAWYVGKSQEDRYLRGYDEIFYNQSFGITQKNDTALIEYIDGKKESYTFTYFE